MENQIPEENLEEPEEQPSGLSEESKAAIQSGAERIFDRPQKSEQQPKSPQTQPPSQQPGQPPSAGQPATPQQPSQPAPPVGQKGQPTPQPERQPGGQTPPKEGEKKEAKPAGSDVKTPSTGEKLGRGLGAARIGADIARHPKEGAKEAGKAVAKEAGKQAAKQLSKRALQALTAETGVGPIIIEALDKLSQVLKKIPGVSAFSNWCWKNKWLVLGILVLLWLTPGLIFAASLAGLGGGGLGGGWGGAVGISEQPFIPVEGKFFPLIIRPLNNFTPGSTRGFGDSRPGGRHHAGVDLIAPAGTPIRAIADGVIVSHYGTFYKGTYATFVDHGDFVINYGENSGQLAPGLKIGSEVRTGQIIGYVGRSWSGSQMLHLEMYTPGTTVNQQWWGTNRPANLLDPTDFVNRLLGGFE